MHENILKFRQHNTRALIYGKDKRWPGDKMTYPYHIYLVSKVEYHTTRYLSRSIRVICNV